MGSGCLRAGVGPSAVAPDSEPTKHFDSSYGNQLNGRSWILRMRVQPSGEQPFDAELKASLKVLFMPRAGDRIDVLYDPGDHSRVAIDPVQELAPVLRVRSGVRAEVALPSGRRRSSRPRQHRPSVGKSSSGSASSTRTAHCPTTSTGSTPRILGLPEPTIVATGFESREGR